MLQPVVIEDLARKAIDRAISGAKSEDSLIELKRELPEPRKAARQIAALCNAAPGTVDLLSPVRAAISLTLQAPP